jgi:hypothetical protein
MMRRSGKMCSLRQHSSFIRVLHCRMKPLMRGVVMYFGAVSRRYGGYALSAHATASTISVWWSKWGKGLTASSVESGCHQHGGNGCKCEDGDDEIRAGKFCSECGGSLLPNGPICDKDVTTPACGGDAGIEAEENVNVSLAPSGATPLFRVEWFNLSSESRDAVFNRWDHE